MLNFSTTTSGLGFTDWGKVIFTNWYGCSVCMYVDNSKTKEIDKSFDILIISGVSYFDNKAKFATGKEIYPGKCFWKQSWDKYAGYASV